MVFHGIGVWPKTLGPAYRFGCKNVSTWRGFVVQFRPSQKCPWMAPSGWICPTIIWKGTPSPSGPWGWRPLPQISVYYIYKRYWGVGASTLSILHSTVSCCMPQRGMKRKNMVFSVMYLCHYFWTWSISSSGHHFWRGFGQKKLKLFMIGVSEVTKMIISWILGHRCVQKKLNLFIPLTHWSLTINSFNFFWHVRITDMPSQMSSNPVETVYGSDHLDHRITDHKQWGQELVTSQMGQRHLRIIKKKLKLFIRVKSMIQISPTINRFNFFLKVLKCLWPIWGVTKSSWNCLYVMILCHRWSET